MTPPKPPSALTIALNRAVLECLPSDGKQDFTNARRGFVGTIPGATIKNTAGRIVWSMEPYAIQQEGAAAPPSVNPSLWRQAQLNAIHGLFEVTPGIYQVRGFDVSNITFIEGDAGVVVVDPLISSECAA